MLRPEFPKNTASRVSPTWGMVWDRSKVGAKPGQESWSRMITDPRGASPKQPAQTHHQEALAILDLIVTQIQEAES